MKRRSFLALAAATAAGADGALGTDREGRGFLSPAPDCVVPRSDTGQTGPPGIL